MVGLLQELYPDLVAVEVKIAGDVTINLFDAVCIGAYAVTHQCGYFDYFSITFLDNTQLTTDIYNKVQEFLYRDFGQTQELICETFSDTADNTVGLDIHWVSKYKVDTDEYTDDIDADVNRTFSYTKEYAQQYRNYRWKLSRFNR